MFATMGSGKLVGLGAGGAVSSLVVYRRAESTRDASTADRARGRRRAAEKQRLAEKSKEAASSRHHTDDDAGGSMRKTPAPAATAPAVAAAGTAAAAPENRVAPDDRAGAKPDAAAEDTVVQTEVVLRSRNPDDLSSRAARRARGDDGAARAGASSSSRAIENGPMKRVRNRNRCAEEKKPTRPVATLAAVAAPFGLLVARNLFRRVFSRDTETRRPARDPSRAPTLSLRAKAAIAAAGADADATAELDRVIGFQAKELRFMRLALAEKDARIAELSAAAKRSAAAGWRDDDELELSDVSRDDFADLDAAADATVDATVDEVLRELARERKEARDGDEMSRDIRSTSIDTAVGSRRFAAETKGVSFAARGKENATLSRRFPDDGSDADVSPPRAKKPLGAWNANALEHREKRSRGASFLDPAVRVARGKSRVHRISPTRRQRETESRMRGAR